MENKNEWWWKWWLNSIMEPDKRERQKVYDVLNRIIAESEKRTWEEAKKIVEKNTPKQLSEDEYDEDTQCGYCKGDDPDCGCEAVEASNNLILRGLNSRLADLK